MTSEEKATMRQMREALSEIRSRAATMPNGGAWAAGLAHLCLASLPGWRSQQDAYTAQRQEQIERLGKAGQMLFDRLP